MQPEPLIAPRRHRQGFPNQDFLTKAGVASAQIFTVGKGISQPRRPNLTETGEDNPEGRRENRRTEIYLDF